MLASHIHYLLQKKKRALESQVADIFYDDEEGAIFLRAEDALDAALESGAASHVENAVLRCEKNTPAPDDTH